MLFVTIEDVDGKIEILVFPKILETTGSIWEEERVILASGKISNKDGVFKLLCDSAEIVNQEQVEKFKRVLQTQKVNMTKEKSDSVENSKLIITLPANSNQDTLKKLSAFFEQCTIGQTKIFLEINGSKLKTPYSIILPENINSMIEKIIPEGKVNIA